MLNDIILETKLVADIKGAFYVPSYQRGYRWGEDEVNRLLDDVFQNGQKNYCLQPVVVRKKEDMAIVKFVASGCPMNHIFPYVMNREKSDENLISGINCSPDTALQEFTFVKKQFKKEDGRTYVHIVQAFSPDDDITPELAHEIGLRFAEYFGGYQALVATHRNTDHIHNHIILNSVNMETGKKFHQSAAEMRQVKEYSNRLCREYGLSETETKSSFKSMPKWKDMLRRKAYSVANRTCCKEDFIFEMEMHGYKVDWQEGHKYITFTTPDGHKCRDNKLFAEQLLRKNLEIYYLLGGCESGLADQYKSYVNDLQPEHSYTVGDGLFNLLKNLLETMPYDELFTPPVEDHQLDKMTVMMLEMMGIKVEPKALVYYSANNQQEKEQGYRS